MLPLARAPVDDSIHSGARLLRPLRLAGLPRTRSRRVPEFGKCSYESFQHNFRFESLNGLLLCERHPRHQFLAFINRERFLPLSESQDATVQFWREDVTRDFP